MGTRTLEGFPGFAPVDKISQLDAQKYLPKVLDITPSIFRPWSQEFHRGKLPG